MGIIPLSSNLGFGRNAMSRIVRRLESKWNRKSRKEPKIKAYNNSKTNHFVEAVKQYIAILHTRPLIFSFLFVSKPRHYHKKKKLVTTFALNMNDMNGFIN